MLTKREEELKKWYDQSDTGCPPCNDMPKLIKDLAEHGVHVNGDVLDAGCGNGRLCRYVATLDNVYSSIGFDYSKGRVERGNKLIEEEGLTNCEIVDGDVYNFKQGKSQYDAIAVFETLEHLAYPTKAIKHLSTLLREGGVLFGSCPINNNFHAHLGVWKSAEDFAGFFPMLEVLWVVKKGNVDQYLVWKYKGW